MPRCRVTTAFTLIELLVVIAIIALLIGILLPALGRARDTARVAKCLSDQRQMALAFTTYANDHREWYPIMPFSTGMRQAWNDGYLANQQIYGGVAGSGAGRRGTWRRGPCRGPARAPAAGCR